ncbi:hypothetical protein D3C86_1727440 [compost metagenome]
MSRDICAKNSLICAAFCSAKATNWVLTSATESFAALLTLPRKSCKSSNALLNSSVSLLDDARTSSSTLVRASSALGLKLTKATRTNKPSTVLTMAAPKRTAMLVMSLPILGMSTRLKTIETMVKIKPR